MISLSWVAARIGAWLKQQGWLDGKAAGLAVLALACAVLWWRGSYYRDDRNRLQQLAQTQEQAVKSASQAAAAKAEAARIETEAKSAAHARSADNEEPPAVANQRVAADRYADERSLRQQADCSVPGRSAQAAPDGAAPDRDRSSPDAVVIPRTQFDQLRDNTLRLERVRLWGEEEIKAGRAVKVGEE